MLQLLVKEDIFVRKTSVFEHKYANFVERYPLCLIYNVCLCETVASSRSLPATQQLENVYLPGVLSVSLYTKLNLIKLILDTEIARKWAAVAEAALA